MNRAPALAVILLLGAGHAPAQSIFTCVDAQGRRHTSDRPIMECLDREQKELSSRGVVKRVVPPQPTAQESDAQAAKEQAEASRVARLRDEQRKERLLVQRYPNQAAHDKARADALAQLDVVAGTIHGRQKALLAQLKSIEEEMEFYKADPAKAPARLKQRQQENAQQRAAQDMALADQEREKARVNARYDEELQQLRALWAAQAAAR